MLCCINARATHYRAGEITYKKLAYKYYEVTVITYTDPSQDANANAVSIVLSWGDGKSEVVPRSTDFPPVDIIPGRISRNTYIARHSYTASGGTFVVSITDPNRVKSILNINLGNSAGIPFYVESSITIDAYLGDNQFPILLNPPIDIGCENFLYTHNPGAYDPDGDSLVYALVPPKQGRNNNVPNYVDPFNSDSFTINSRTGTVYWSKPLQRGIYNIAISIIEYRGNPAIPVGKITRDMQIEIRDCENQPPVVAPMPDVCTRVGKNISRVITATDPDLNPAANRITLIPIGGPFVQGTGTATLSPNPAIASSLVNGIFSWTPQCFNIHHQPAQVLFKATDNFATPLSHIDGFFIKVIGPEPKNVQINQEGNSAFRITWNKDSCNTATRYDIYRRVDSSFWNPDSCEQGVPAYTKFVKIGSVNTAGNPNNTTFLDNDNGAGLSPLVNYCYRVVSFFPDRSANGQPIGGNGWGSESFASIEICDVIIRSKPIITKVSIRNTSVLNGSLDLNWIRPDTLDTAVYTAPYRLVIKRRPASIQAYTPIATFTYNSFAAITDSSLVDTLIDTKNTQYYYQIDLESDISTTPKAVDQSPPASSLFLSIYATDNTNILSWRADVKWTNTQFTVYRKNALNVFDSIGFSETGNFSDTGLVNGIEYCYVVKSIGAYSLLPYPIINFSQENCGVPVDTIRPCAPLLTVLPPCSAVALNDFTVKLSWVPRPACAEDVVRYKIYYKHFTNDPYVLLATTNDQFTLTYTDTREILRKSIAGCYVVVGVDSFNNESFFGNQICIDNCPIYNIPNVFTPEGDGRNDLLNPFPYRFIDRVHFSAYNRWGNKVFETEDIDLNWNGKDQESGNELSPGVYFYTCDVYEQFLEGLRKRTIRGTIQIIR